MNKIVVFGAGLVSRPLVRYLLDHGFSVCVASRTVSKAEALIAGHANGRAVSLDANDDTALRALVAQADLAVSLLPPPQHPQVARACLDHGKHLVTTSYVSPAMKAMHAEAVDRDLILLNEIGADPGIDHMSAMQVIHAERARGGTLVGFSSWCGGLPAPEANDNAFGYKFSWAPRGVLVAARNAARYLENGRLVEVEPDALFSRPALVEIPGLGEFEGYPNRDSVAYLDTYHFDADEVRSIFRGTLRNRGHCKLYSQLVALGLLEQQPEYALEGKTYRQLMEELFGAPVEQTIPARLGVQPADSPLEALRSIHMLSDLEIEIPRSGRALVDVMATRMAEDLAYAEGERDMIVMRHDLTFVHDEARQERVTAILVDYGIPGGDSSVSRTVSLPAAIGVRMILEGEIVERGVCLPILPGIYEPVLAELAGLGISFSETREPVG
ncbi:MAG: saccharopine dehydrogenase NADP-binding domain-containing protein [Deltaproteobacteria bacterium]|nr:saccharopine dehydrogenase NADP-binding domain-containing protein [Deltaproteobacteria bacterium]